MRLHFVLVRRVPPVPSPVLVEVTERLEASGFTVTGAIPEECLTRVDVLRPGDDLVILKSHTELALSLGGLLDAEGARILNPYRSCVAAQDKVTATRRLRAAGVSVPVTWATADVELAREACGRGAVVVKPARGHRGAGVVVARCPDDLPLVDSPPGAPLVVQELVPGPGEDLKVYVAGEHVFAVRKPFGPDSFTRPGRPVAVSEEVRDIALRSGVALGLGLYGLDVIESPAGPVVVDVNYFPGYKGVPGAAAHIASYIEAYARGRVALVEGGLRLGRETPSEDGDAAPSPGETGARERVPTRTAARPIGRGRRAWERAKREGQGLFRHPVAPLAAEGFLSRLSFGIISFALPLFAYRLGMGLPAIGLLLSLNLVVAMALKPLLGAATDRLGPKTALAIAIGLRTFVCLLLVLSGEPWHLFVVRALHGVSMALRDPSAAVLVSDAGGERSVAAAFAWYQTAKTVAGSVGRAAAGVLIALSGGYAGAFAAALVLSALPLVVVIRGVRPVEHAGGGIGGAGLAGTASAGAVERSTIFAFASVGFLITGSAYLLANLFPLFATEYAGLSPAAVGAAYLIGGVLALSGPVWGWLADRANPRLVLSVRSGANIGSSLIYLVAPNLAGVLAGKALDDTGKAAFRPAWGSLMAHVAGQGRSRRARIMAWLGVGEDAGEVAGPLVAALVWSAWGIPALLVFRIVAAAAAELVTVRMTRSVAWGDEALMHRTEEVHA